jgi:hypothetical protein
MRHGEIRLDCDRALIAGGGIAAFAQLPENAAKIIVSLGAIGVEPDGAQIVSFRFVETPLTREPVAKVVLLARRRCVSAGCHHVGKDYL